jgi:hypothetical protein
MFAVPLATPVTIPDASTVALAVLLLVHVPPDTGCPNVVVLPIHKDLVPVIVAGVASTVTTTVA